MKKYHLVVVDDDALCLKSAISLLNDEDFKVSGVRSGKDLLSFMQKANPDLIMLDVRMPDMDGFETYKKLREFEDSDERSHTPVIFLTGDDDTESEHQGLSLGASDFIRKPINKDIIRQRIQNIISNTERIENLTEEATIDKLTGFYNKSVGSDKIMKLCNATGGMLLILDLDDFKLVNDLYGHDMGDAVLVNFSEITRRNCRSGDVLCRIGGDEFLAFFVGTSDENVITKFTQKINSQLTDKCKELMGNDFNIPIGISVGCVAVSEHENDYNTLFQLADKALYMAKQNGKHGCEFADLDAEISSTNIIDPESELNHMIKLCEERSMHEKAMLVGQDAFIWIYRFIDRFATRHNGHLTRLTFSLSMKNPMDKDEFLAGVDHFENVLRYNLRKNDVITRDKANTFFLVLPELAKNNVPLVISRILGSWGKENDNDDIDVSFSFDSIDHDTFDRPVQ